MKRSSIKFMFAVRLVAAFLLFEVAFNIYDIGQFYQAHSMRKMAELELEANFAKQLVSVRQDMGELEGFLKNRLEARTIDFWALVYDGKVYKTSIEPEELESFVFTLNPPTEIRKFETEGASYAYVTEKAPGGFDLIMGVRHDTGFKLQQYYRLQGGVLVKGLVGLLAIAFLLFLYYFRDFMASIRRLTSKDHRTSDVKIKSKEADVLARGIAAFEDQNEQLARERDLLQKQVLPSLRSELMSGRKPPYSFDCTLVRTDINNFSTIYNEHDIEAFTATINDFFTDVSHIVARYGGLVHEFIGDEVIFYFKDEDVGNSVAIALSCLQDINEVASRYHKFTTKERGYGFTVKSSLAHGKIHFRRFVNGYNLAGAVLIETVRILSTVHEKEGNSVLCENRHLRKLAGIAELEPFATVKLKGFAQDVKLWSYKGHRLMQSFMVEGNLVMLDFLKYYRDDHNISEMLSWARLQARNGRYEAASRIIGTLRTFTVTKSDGAPKKALLCWIDELTASLTGQQKPEKGVDESPVRLFASILKLIENLIPVAEFDESVEKALNKAAEINNRRVIANALEVMAHFKSESDPGFAVKLIRHQDNRVAASALLREGLRDLSKTVLKGLSGMLRSRKPTHVASALYAIGELSQQHREKDVVYYSTQVDFLALVDRIPDFVMSHDPMVRKQALIAARKCSDSRIFAEVWASVAKSKDEALLREVNQHLGPAPSEPERRAA